jgi:hypothetical protein
MPISFENKPKMPLNMQTLPFYLLFCFSPWPDEQPFALRQCSRVWASHLYDSQPVSR